MTDIMCLIRVFTIYGGEDSVFHAVNGFGIDFPVGNLF
jgi:hypothetical protein